ncbi:MAG: hypothetical protein IPL61_36350 [Myxococcales bacterium]|nr:hypothetical protein [Myxococcales bacterium]
MLARRARAPVASPNDDDDDDDDDDRAAVDARPAAHPKLACAHTATTPSTSG